MTPSQEQQGDSDSNVKGTSQEYALLWKGVDAALSGDVNMLVQTLLAHPWILSIDVAEKITAEMLAAHAAFPPQFSKSMPDRRQREAMHTQV